jgi:hypothetical protein
MNQIRIVENPDLQPITTTPAAAVLDGYVTQLINGTVTQLLPQNSDLEGFEVGPGLITILGAYPGMGKTALTSKIMFDALSLKPDLTAVVANAETGFDVLLRRQASCGQSSNAYLF